MQQEPSHMADTSPSYSHPYPSPRPYFPATSAGYGPIPNLMAPHQRSSNHINYIPTSGNAPLLNDYVGMPCNLQERMIIGQQGAHGFSLEDTLANLPYDAIQAISSNPGKQDIV